MGTTFGTQFSDQMVVARYQDGRWGEARPEPVAPLELHPGAHVLHYSSTCFEGLKAFRSPDGSARIFRLDRHVARFAKSAELLCLPLPDAGVVERMIREAVRLNIADIPELPGALYLRPTLIGLDANIGAAGASPEQVLLYVLAAPVGEYFASGKQGLRILIEERGMRSTPGFGEAKTGGNYAAALRHVIQARKAHKADQVLFCPGGDVQETGASNFFLLDDKRVMTKPLDGSFLDGVTRNSILTLASDLGYEVIERSFSVADIKQWIGAGEAALSGTAAVLAGVGTFVHQGKELPVGNGEVGPNTLRLRQALTDIQFGDKPDPHSWLFTQTA